MEQNATLYAYVYEQLLTDIYNRKYICNDNLPSLLELCEKYHVGRNTVRTAIGKLEEDGLVISDKGSVARVIFDLDKVQHNYSYRKILVTKKASLREVFQTLGMIMPEIVSACLDQATSAQMEELKAMMTAINNDNAIMNESQLSDKVMELYFFILSFLGNTLIQDLFGQMMRFVFFPLSMESRESGRLKANIRNIKKILMTALKIIVKGNNMMLRKTIKNFCSKFEKESVRYIDKIGCDIETSEEITFIWFSNRQSEFLYSKVQIDILIDISQQKYRIGDLLPSIDCLAKKYEVSQRTIRKAITELNQLRVIHTINGIGSKICLDFHNQENTLYKDKIFRETMKQYYEALELSSMMTCAYSKKILQTINQEDLQQFIYNIEETQDFVIYTIVPFILEHANPCVQMIYHELSKLLVCHIFIEMSEHLQNITLEQLQSGEKLLEALRAKNFKSSSDIINKMLQITCKMTKSQLTYLAIL